MNNLSLNLNGPEKYLYSIKGDSEFFLLAQKSLIYYYQVIYRDNEVKRRNAFDRVEQNIEIYGNNVAYYFYVKLRYLDPNDYHEISKLYNKFQNHYSSIKVSGHNDVLYKDKLFDLEDVVFDSPCIDFMFQGYLLVAAHNNNLLEEQEKRLADINEFLEAEKKDDLKFILRNTFLHNEKFVDEVYKFVEMLNAQESN